ncbi:hypothetical protein SLE2022_069080 [Rubroshorea leprosula]
MGVKESESQGFGDEAEETLSLCEFVRNSTDGGDRYCNDFTEEQKISSSDQDFFEFFGEGFTPSTYHTADNIIFCGKLIPCEEPAVVTEKPQDPRKGCKQQKSKKIGRIFSGKKSKSEGEKRDKFDFSVKEVSVLATPVKSRWYLFAFGVGRFPTEMELKDMKMRQKRKSRAAMMSRSDSGVEAVKDKRRTGKGLWRLLKLLGRVRRASAVVKASFG